MSPRVKHSKALPSKGITNKQLPQFMTALHFPSKDTVHFLPIYSRAAGGGGTQRHRGGGGPVSPTLSLQLIGKTKREPTRLPVSRESSFEEEGSVLGRWAGGSSDAAAPQLLHTRARIHQHVELTGKRSGGEPRASACDPSALRPPQVHQYQQLWTLN